VYRKGVSLPSSYRIRQQVVMCIRSINLYSIREQEIMERAAADARESLGVVELYNQTHLDAVVDATGPGVVAICFYSRVRFRHNRASFAHETMHFLAPHMPCPVLK
jgi:hypothetical protein